MQQNNALIATIDIYTYTWWAARTRRQIWCVQRSSGGAV